MNALIAQKIGMTRIVDPETGKVTPVTVCLAPKNTVLQVKNSDKDNTDAVVLGAFERKNFGKNENKKFKSIHEVTGASDLKVGDQVGTEVFEGVENVVLTGFSKGRGFAGVIKRHGFSRGPETHGSHHHREPGSVGTSAKPGRIMKGKKLPGRYGNDRITLRAKIVKIDEKNQLIAIKGAVPGANKGYVYIQAQ